MDSLLTSRPRAALVSTLVLLVLVGFTPRLLAQTDPAAEDTPQKIAVLELESSGATEVETTATTDRLREELLRTGKFTLVDRSRLDAIVEEQRLQQATCATAECALEVGRILGVSKIVTGRLSKLGPTTWQVSSQLLDVTTAQTERAESVLHEGRLVDLLQGAIPDLAEKLAGEGGPSEVPPAAAQLADEPEPPAEEEPEPPGTKPTRIRAFGAPASFAMTVALEYSDGSTADVTFSGGGIALGAEALIEQQVSVWVTTQFGSINTIDIETNTVGSASGDATGDYSMVAGGVDYVIDNDPWRVLLGGGLFNAAVEITEVEGVPLKTDATVSGLLFDFRFDYTFESGVFLGGGLNLGFGSASGTLTDGADTANGTVVSLLIPIGYTF